MPERERAVEAVEDYLQIDDFIESQKDVILKRLEEHYEHVSDESEAPLLFIAEVLPLISGIVQVGSSVDNFRRAVGWTKACVPSADPGSFLTTLTLIYILEKGRQEFAYDEDEEKRVTWSRMAEAVLMQMQYV